jgi:hypothetical protein
MAAVFESREEETMKKITKKANNILATSEACQDLPDELKKYVIEACRRCVRQIPIAEADPGKVQDCLFEELEMPLKKMLKQLKPCLDDLSKACSGYKDEAW